MYIECMGRGKDWLFLPGEGLAGWLRVQLFPMIIHTDHPGLLVRGNSPTYVHFQVNVKAYGLH